MPPDETIAALNVWLRMTARGIIGNSTDMDEDDLVQEGRVTLWKALDSYDPSKSPDQVAWAKFRARKAMIGLVTRPRWANRPDAHDPVTLYDKLVQRDFADDVLMAYHEGEVAQAIDRLTPTQQRYVRARFWGGLSHSEMVQAGVFSYDPSALWNSRRNGARWKLEKDLCHLATVHD